MRRKRGYALVSTMVIGCFAIASLMALSGFVMLDTQSESRRKQTAILSNAAEAGLDYAIHKFNTEYPCALDPVSGNSLESDLPPGYLDASYGTVSNNAANVSVKITVKKVTDTDWAALEIFSTIYNPQLDLAKSRATGNGVPPSNNLADLTGATIESDYWRVLESKATVAGRSKTFRAILMPFLSAPVTLGSPPSNGSPMFKYGLFANTSLSTGNLGITVSTNESSAAIPPSSSTEGYRYKMDLATNQIASIGANSDIQGNLIVMSSFSNPGQPVVSNDGLIEGRVAVNNDIDASTVISHTGQLSDPSDNVLANADPTTTRVGDGGGGAADNTTPVSTAQSTDPFQMNPSFGSGNNARPLGTLDQVQAGSETPTIGKGDYQSYGLSTQNMDTSAAPIQFDNSSPVRIFVKDSPGSTEAVSIDASMLTTPSDPRNLQIYYSGTKPINISLGSNKTFSGLIYAPLATVQTTGSGTFQGAIVGDTVNINHSGSMIVNTDLSDVSQSANYTAGLYRNINGSENPLARGWRWKPVTWEDVH